MSYARTKSVNFGSSRTGLATVAWSLDGSTWSTTGVSEVPASSGIYSAEITFADDFNGQLSWKTGEVSGERFAAEDVAPPASVSVSLPEPPPDGYGPVGTGSVAINQDYPTAGNLSYQNSEGQGIGGAQVRAYLANEWAASTATAVIRGQTITLDTGDWANVINLDPGNYQIVFIAESYETSVVALTVA